MGNTRIVKSDGSLNRIRKLVSDSRKKGNVFDYIEKTEGQKVTARVDFGRWLADCECGGAELVNPTDGENDVFFCMSCHNSSIGGKLRKVKFPKESDIEQIESLLMDRPQNESVGKTELDIAFNAKPLVGKLSRSWNPNETIQDLINQNSEIPEELKKIKKVK